RPLAAGASGFLRTDHRRRGGDPRRPRGECSMSGTSPSTGPDAGRHPIITEEDLASLDTSEGHGEEARPEEPVNAACATLGGWIAGGAIVAQGRRGHIAVDVLVGRLRGRALERAHIAIWAFSTLLLAYLTYLAVYLIPPMAAQSTPIMGWPQLGSFSAFIVMVAVMAVQAGARTVHCIRHGIPDDGSATVPPGHPGPASP